MPMAQKKVFTIIKEPSAMPMPKIEPVKILLPLEIFSGDPAEIKSIIPPQIKSTGAIAKKTRVMPK